MDKISFSDGIGIAGIVLAIVIVVLDKAGKLKGGWLVCLLVVAGAMTLFLAIGNSWVLDAPAKWRVWRGVLMFSLVALTYSGVAIWISSPSQAESRQQEPPKQDANQLKSRLGGVIVEGTQIKKLCEAIPMPYTTPATNRPDIANAIANWQMRVDVVLSLDSDPRAAKIWNRAVLYSAPTPQPSIAIYCTVLNVKLDALNRIQRVISTSSQQQIAQLQNLIAEGSTLRDSCMNNDNLNSVIQQEVNWVGKASDWLTDNIDESYSREFNSSPLNDGMLMPGNHPPELAAIWKRTKGRMDTLERFAREVTAKPLS